MTVAQFAKELALMKDRVINFKKYAPKGNNTVRDAGFMGTHVSNGSVRRVNQRIPNIQQKAMQRLFR